MIRKTLLVYLGLLCCSQASGWVCQPSFNHLQVLQQRDSTLSSTSCRFAKGRKEEESSTTAMVKPVAASGLCDSELQLVLDIIQETVSLSDLEELDDRFANINVEFDHDSSSIEIHPAPDAVVGATGRTLILSIDDQLGGEGMDEVIQYVVAQAIDQQLYSEEQTLLKQPILVSIQQTEDLANTDLQELLGGLIQDQIFMYEMATPLPMSAEAVLAESALKPTLHVEMDGDFVTDVWSQEQVWDTSSVLVFDNLVSDDLRKQLLDVTLGGTSTTWNDVENGPNPERWVRGGLIDIPDDDENEKESPSLPSTSWGLSDEAIDDICFHPHDAIQDFECILSQLFPQFVVTRLPEAVFGDTVSPLTANAPTFKDEFSIHIDGDPNQTPPSPWTDVYGRYPNRIRGKPRFMSCLLYLNDEWEEDWGAQTRFLDLPTDKLHGVTPKPGRCVLMDQDCSHTVVAPNESAGNRPRYSLVWKLILHPRENRQDMTDLAVGRSWPVPTLFGSADRHEVSKSIE